MDKPPERYAWRFVVEQEAVGSHRLLRGVHHQPYGEQVKHMNNQPNELRLSVARIAFAREVLEILHNIPWRQDSAPKIEDMRLLIAGVAKSKGLHYSEDVLSSAIGWRPSTSFGTGGDGFCHGDDEVAMYYAFALHLLANGEDLCE